MCFITGVNYHECVSLSITVINEGMWRNNTGVVIVSVVTGVFIVVISAI